MILKIVLFYLSVILLGFVSGEEQPIEHTNCGQILNDAEGYIAYYYEEGQTYNQMERCVWTIRHPGAIQYEFDVQYIGFTNDIYDGLTFTTFVRQWPPYHLEKDVREPGFFTIDGSLVIVTFHSDGGNQHRGFYFRYRAVLPTGSVPPQFDVSNLSHDIILSKPFEFISYPHPFEVYDNKELTSIIYAPNNFTYSTINYDVIYKRKNVAVLPVCRDGLYMYNFLGDGQYPVWVEPHQICGNTESSYGWENDMSLNIFLSDELIQGSGFNFTFQAKSENQEIILRNISRNRLRK